MAELVREFVAGLLEGVKAMEGAVTGKDLELLQILAHQLNDADGGYGFPAIAEPADDAEQGVDGEADFEQAK